MKLDVIALASCNKNQDGWHARGSEFNESLASVDMTSCMMPCDKAAAPIIGTVIITSVVITNDHILSRDLSRAF
jgi:hypothetical protein